MTSVALAQSGGEYDLTWSTVEGGGWTFSTGGAFWGGRGLAVQYTSYLPLVLRNAP